MESIITEHQSRKVLDSQCWQVTSNWVIMTIQCPCIVLPCETVRELTPGPDCLSSTDIANYREHGFKLWIWPRPTLQWRCLSARRITTPNQAPDTPHVTHRYRVTCPRPSHLHYIKTIREFVMLTSKFSPLVKMFTSLFLSASQSRSVPAQVTCNL